MDSNIVAITIDSTGLNNLVEALRETQVDGKRSWMKAHFAVGIDPDESP